MVNLIPRHGYQEALFKDLSKADMDIKKHLAITFAEHVRWIGGIDTNEDSASFMLLESARDFLKGQITIQDVARNKRRYYDMTASDEWDGISLTLTHNVRFVISVAHGVCCLGELKSANLVSELVGEVPRVEHVAVLATDVVFRRITGVTWAQAVSNEAGSTTNLQDGYQAVEKEAQWQLEQLQHMIQPPTDS